MLFHGTSKVAIPSLCRDWNLSYWLSMNPSTRVCLDTSPDEAARAVTHVKEKRDSEVVDEVVAGLLCNVHRVLEVLDRLGELLLECKRSQQHSVN